MPDQIAQTLITFLGGGVLGAVVGHRLHLDRERRPLTDGFAGWATGSTENPLTLALSPKGARE
jgi:hypothetical protein